MSLKTMRAFFILCIFCYACPLQAQRDPEFVLSAALGWGLAAQRAAELDINESIYAGYRLWPHGLAVAYFDYSRFVYPAQTYGVTRRMNAGLIGLKVTLPIPDNRVAPYFMGAIGLSSFTATSDTVYSFGNSEMSQNLYRVKSGNTVSYLGSVGADIFIYRNCGLALEIRTSFGSDMTMYDILILYRLGIFVGL
jgi:hypothetical protein